MPGTTNALDVQQLGKELVELTTMLQPWAPQHAERMKGFIEKARQSMAQSQYLVIANLMLACEEVRVAVVTAIESGATLGASSHELERLNRVICEATNQSLYTNQSPEF